jgi:hypothetical protein
MLLRKPILGRSGCRIVFRVIPTASTLVFDLCHHLQSDLAVGVDVASRDLRAPALAGQNLDGEYKAKDGKLGSWTKVASACC